jgi:hypothetical protein
MYLKLLSVTLFNKVLETLILKLIIKLILFISIFYLSKVQAEDVFTSSVSPDISADKIAVLRAATDYIESQHKRSGQMMQRGLHQKLVKRTYWQTKAGSEFIMETDFNTMVSVAENYNKSGDKFSSPPKIDIKILDIEQRIASVKLIADDWVDYMHLIKNTQGQWKIINVLWQYHDITKHTSKR